MKKIIIILFLLTATKLYSQVDKAITTIQADMSTIGYNKKTAIRDTTQENIYILVPGSWLGYTHYASDNIFENKYGVTYTFIGCIRYETDNEVEYNKIIFKYLDNKFGTAWRNEVRTDVIRF